MEAARASKGKHTMPRFIRFLSTLCFLLFSWQISAFAQDAPSRRAPPQGQPQVQPAPAGPRGRFLGNAVFGRIESISPTELKLAAPDGSTVTVHLTPKTVFRIEQDTAKLEDFKAGTAVFVRGTKTGDFTWDADLVATRSGPQPMTQTLGKDFIAGTVKSIDGTKITILRVDNVTQTIELDENTSLLKRRESITLADVHPGDTVAVRGETRDSNFVPKTLSVVDPAQFERGRRLIGAGGAGGPASANPPAPPPEKKPEPETKPPQERR
jgi:hypothetical protein